MRIWKKGIKSCKGINILDKISWDLRLTCKPEFTGVGDFFMSPS